jgi:hypothetical protein
MSFPKKDIPKGPETSINIDRLKVYLNMSKHCLSVHQWKRGQRLIDSLTNGTPAFQKTMLPPISVPNAASAFVHGNCLTKKIASWIDAGFVASPFQHPPLPGFRSNSLIAVSRKDSIRPIVNMSEPKGASFNDNLEKKKIEKVYMRTHIKMSLTKKKTDTYRDSHG